MYKTRKIEKSKVNTRRVDRRRRGRADERKENDGFWALPLSSTNKRGVCHHHAQNIQHTRQKEERGEGS